MDTSNWIIIIYFVTVVSIGIWLAKRNKTSDDWANGGAGMGIVLIAVGLAGTRLGGVAIYGVASDVMTTGLWNLWYGITTCLAFLMMAFVFIIPYRRLKLNTIGEIFIRRFGSTRCRVLTSLCVQTEYFILIVVEVLLIGGMMNSLTGIGHDASILLAALVIMTCTSLAGLQGAAFNNMIHLLVIVVGLSAILLINMDKVDGWGGMVERTNLSLAAAGIDKASWWSFIGLGWMPIIAMIFSATIHTPAASIYVNYSRAAKNERTLILGLCLAGLIALIIPGLSGMVGMQGLAFYGDDPSLKGSKVLIQLAMDAGPILGGVAIAAIIAALISTAGPVLLAGSTMFVNDWLPNSEGFSSQKKLFAYRITSIVYCSLAAVVTYIIDVSSVLGLVLFAFAMVVPPAIAITFILFWKRTTEQAVFWGIALGYGSGVVIWILKHWYDFGFDAVSYATTIIPLVVVPLASLMTKQSEAVDGDFYKLLRKRKSQELQTASIRNPAGL